MATGFITLTPHNERVKQQLSNEEKIERYLVYGHPIISKIVADSLERKGAIVIRTLKTRYRKKKIYTLPDGTAIPIVVTTHLRKQWQIQISDTIIAKVTEKQRLITEDLNNRFNQKHVSCTWDIVGNEIII